MKGQYTEEVTTGEIPFPRLVSEILGIKNVNQINIEQFCDSDINYERKYNVYKISVNGENYVLKKSDEEEISVYSKLLEKKSLPVPKYYGFTTWQETKWILIEFVKGTDLRNFTEEMAHASAKSIATIMNTYWQATESEFESQRKDHRFERYWKRINKRAECLKNETEIKEAYDKFLERQKNCPRTLSNGDFLQFNALIHEGNVVLIDWGFAGIMPYSLDIARLITHGSEDKHGFPFYMNDELRKIFIDEVYDRLLIKPDRKQYLQDIKLSQLNEYIEFIEEELSDSTLERDEFFDDYYTKAQKLAKEIL